MAELLTRERMDAALYRGRRRPVLLRCPECGRFLRSGEEWTQPCCENYCTDRTFRKATCPQDGEWTFCYSFLYDRWEEG